MLVIKEKIGIVGEMKYERFKIRKQVMVPYKYKLNDMVEFNGKEYRIRNKIHKGFLNFYEVIINGKDPFWVMEEYLDLIDKGE